MSLPALPPGALGVVFYACLDAPATTLAGATGAAVIFGATFWATTGAGAAMGAAGAAGFGATAIIYALDFGAAAFT